MCVSVRIASETCLLNANPKVETCNTVDEAIQRFGYEFLHNDIETAWQNQKAGPMARQGRAYVARLNDRKRTAEKKGSPNPARLG